jgi:hypothetical protein
MDLYKNKLSLMITPLDYPKRRWEIILNLALMVIDHHLLL